MKRTIGSILAIATLLPATLSAQSGVRRDDYTAQQEWSKPGRNPMMRLMNITSPQKAQKTAKATSWLISAFSGWSLPSTGAYYTPQDSTAYRYSGGRGGAPAMRTPGGWSVAFFDVDIPFDTAIGYGGWTDAAGRFTQLGGKHIRSYDARNNMLEDWQESWTSGAPVPYNRSLYTYSSTRMETAKTQHYQSGAWLDYGKDSFEYNASGQRIVSTSQNWYATPGIWKNSFRHFYSYDAGGRLTLDSMEQWNLSWTPYQQDQYSYTAAGNLALHTKLSWMPSLNAWKFHDDEVRSYNSANDLVSIVTQDSFKYAATGHYRKVDSMVNAAISGGLPTITIDYDQRNSTTWQPARRYVMSYNSFGQVLSEQGTHWENNSWMITPSAADVEYRYHYATDSATSTTVGGTPLNVGNGLTIYPIPAREKLCFRLADATAGNYAAAVVNANGQVCMRWSTIKLAGEETIDVSCLPAGQYWLQLLSNEAQVSGAFTIVH